MTAIAQSAPGVPALDFRDLAQSVVRQPELFAALAGVAEEQNIVRAAQERRYTGSRVPEARAAQIVALRLAGTSLRGIERQLGADKRTVAAVVEIAERQGVLPPLKEVLQRRLGVLADRTADVIEQELDSDEPDAQLIKAGWVGLGIAADKSAALANIGELHLHVHQGAVAAGSDPASEYARLLRGAPAGPTVDAESEVCAPVAAVSGGSSLVATALDHISGRPPIESVAPVGAPISGVDDQVPSGAAASEPPATRGAGGVANPGGVGGGDGKA